MGLQKKYSCTQRSQAHLSQFNLKNQNRKTMKMKNILLFTLLIFSLSTFAQSTTPRTGTSTGSDNTYRVLNYKFIPVTDATGVDTVKVNTRHYHTEVSIPILKDSVCVQFTSVANAYYGDEINFCAISTTGTKLKFIGSNYEVGSGTSTLTITATKRANIRFIFDGTKWVEVSRLVQ